MNLESPMKSITSRSAVGALAALAVLATPAAVSAHPGIYTVAAKLARAPEVQTITVNATGGTFKPSAGATAVAFNAQPYAVQAALGADPAIGVDAAGTANVVVTGAAGGPYTLTYQGTKAALNVDQVVPDATALTGGAGTAVAATTTQGAGANVVYPAPVSNMVDQNQYIIANDGFALGYRETNGLAVSGMLNLKFAPGGLPGADDLHPVVGVRRDADGRAAARDLPGRGGAVRHGEHQQLAERPVLQLHPVAEDAGRVPRPR